MSGLRDELAALADEWDDEDAACGCTGCGNCTRAVHWTPQLRALLDRFPPEAEGEALSPVRVSPGGPRRRDETPLAASPEEQDR